MAIALFTAGVFIDQPNNVEETVIMNGVLLQRTLLNSSIVIAGLSFAFVLLPSVSHGDATGICQIWNGREYVTGPCGSGGSSSAPPAPSYYDYEADRQRQEAEYQRQLEEERQRQLELKEQRRREEEAARRRQEEFERNKQEALQSMKGIAEGELGLKGTGAGELGLKDLGGTGSGEFGLKSLESAPKGSGAKGEKSAAVVVKEPAPEKIRKDLDAASQRIPVLEKDIQGLQTLLRQFGAGLRGNASEFEKWQETFNAAADNSLKNSKDYALSMFLQYNLLGSLERQAKKDAFAKLDALINSSDPQMKKWLGEQLKKRNLELARVQKVVATGSLGGDFAALLGSDPQETGSALDALLFVNDLLEATKVLSWSASQYFQQAKMIGETYTDLAVMAVSGVNVRRLEQSTDAYNREISYLSTRLKDATREMNCLKGCLEKYSDRCVDKCTGRTRFGTPPPVPRP